MKRLYIVVEGQTEQEFVNGVVAPYLRDFGLYGVTPVLVRTSRSGRGGMVNYQHLYNTIKMLLQSSHTDFMVTTFIDFFRIPHSLPEYEECMKFASKDEQVDALEDAINRSVNDRRFFSYVQKHEFEALLFSSNKGFEYYFPAECASETSRLVASYKNPEEINSSPQGAPSKRLLAIKPDYNKVLEGNLIALETGINVMLEKCERFARWVNRIILFCKCA